MTLNENTSQNNCSNIETGKRISGKPTPPPSSSEGGNINDLIVSAVRYEVPVGKPYGYKNGEVIKGANYRPEYAVGETHAFQSFEVLSSWRKGLTSEFMLTSGTFDTIGEVAVVYRGAEGSGGRGRTMSRHGPTVRIEQALAAKLKEKTDARQTR